MAQAYTAPNWTDDSGQGVSASQLQALSNCMEGIVQGTDKAVHAISLNGTNLTLTYVDGSIETFTATGLKGISSVSKTTSGNVDTYTFTFTDGTTYSFDVHNSGDMSASDYDADETVKDAGGIVAYVDSRILGAIEGSY